VNILVNDRLTLCGESLQTCDQAGMVSATQGLCWIYWIPLK
jgi:hypothetical protein